MLSRTLFFFCLSILCSACFWDAAEERRTLCNGYEMVKLGEQFLLVSPERFEVEPFSGLDALNGEPLYGLEVDLLACNEHFIIAGAYAVWFYEELGDPTNPVMISKGTARTLAESIGVELRPATAVWREDARRQFPFLLFALVASFILFAIFLVRRLGLSAYQT